MLPFYKDLLLVECSFERTFEEEYLVGSYLISKDENVAEESKVCEAVDTENQSKTARKIYILNGTSPPIHEANDKHTLVLETYEDALAYLRFFVAFVWGDDGGFWICDREGDIPWLNEADASLLNEFKIKLKPAESKGRKEDKWLIDAPVLYGCHLFEAKFKVLDSGMIEMFEDDPLSEEKIPILADRRVDGLRVLPISQMTSK